MSLELTKEEAARLIKLRKEIKKRSGGHPWKYSPEKEALIIARVKEGASNMDIQRETGAPKDKINELKRKNGLWGV